MARKTNYTFKKNSRAKAKAAKREAKRQAKIASKTEEQAADPSVDSDGGEDENVAGGGQEDAQP